MFIFYTICAYICYKLYKKILYNNQMILDNILMIDLYDNTYNNYSKESNYVLFAFNQIPT